MGPIYLALYKGRGTLFNRLVRLWTRSKYSHCELVLAAGSEFCAAAIGFPMPQRYSPAQLGEVVQHINTLTPSGQWNEANA